MPDIESMQKEPNEIQRILREHTNCEELIFINYTTENNLRTLATFKLVGCPFTNYEHESDRLIGILKDSIDYICEIKSLNFQFVNKGVYRNKKYYKCQ